MKFLALLLFILTACCSSKLYLASNETRVTLVHPTDGWQCTFGWSSSDCMNQIASELHQIFLPYDMGFTTQDSTHAFFELDFTNEDGTGWSVQDNSAGAAPTQCDSSLSGVGLVFRSGRDGKRDARVGAHELGHLLGLDHVSQKSDIMNPTEAGSTSFLDLSFPTLNGACRGEQNSNQVLLKRLGARK